MKFEDLDTQMRQFETSIDQWLLPETWVVARLDGRGFTRLTKETLELKRPFDEQFRDAMITTVKHLVGCGFKVTYAYTQSDEISLLFPPDEHGFGRKVRKINSVLAGEASAAFTHSLQAVAAFDCRLCPLPNEKRVIDYFRWRAEDAHRNSLNACLYWTLREQGKGKKEATATLNGLSVAEKNELLFQAGINYNDLPAWQKRGIGCWRQSVEKVGYNPKTGEQVSTVRQEWQVEMDLPKDHAYSDFLGQLIQVA